jgi:nicotinamide mononucleotide transporter PnuC
VIAYPTMFYGIYNWAKNRVNDKSKGQVVRVRNVRIRELLVIIALTPLVWAGLFFMLRAFGTAFVVLATCGTLLSITGAYFLARRSWFSMFFYVIADFTGIAIWILIFIGGHTGAVAMIALCVMYLITDLYGIYQWGSLKKRQEKIRNSDLVPRALERTF